MRRTNNVPVPAYGITRDTGATRLEKNSHEYLKNSPRGIHNRRSSSLIKFDNSTKISVNG